MERTSPFLKLTAADLMSREVITLGGGDSFNEVAQLFAREQISGAPVVNDEGRCVGILSLTDLVRWTRQQGGPTREGSPPMPRTCSFQTKERDRFGNETIHCTMPAGVCPMQQKGTAPDGGANVVCGQPSCVPTDWQVVVMNDSEPSAVRDFMTTDVVLAHPADPIADIVQKMIDTHIHRVIVVDNEHRPVGVVSSTDCLAAALRDFHAAEQSGGAPV